MTYQDIYIYGIIRKKMYKLINPDIITFFTDNNSREILECIFILYHSKDAITENSVKNLLANKGLKPIIEAGVIEHLHELLIDDRYVNDNITDMLRSEYLTEQMSLLSNALISKKYTIDIKADSVLKIADRITNSRKANDLQCYDAVMNNFYNNIENKDKDKGQSIILQDENLIKIFGKTIYPFLHTITAKPNNYKSTLMQNLVNHFDEMNVSGAFFTFEDSAEMLSIKITAIKSGIAKDEIYRADIKEDNLGKYIRGDKGRIWIYDLIKTSTQVIADVNNLIACYNIRWIAIDYIQLVKRLKNQSEYDCISDFTDSLLQLNKIHKIPIFQISQVAKGDVQNKKVIGLGDEKGSSNIVQNSRWSCSINDSDMPANNRDYDRKLINVYKTTFSAKSQIVAVFNPKTGKLVDTREVPNE